jgi:uncharacterized protein YaiE (UPF0345 family)
MSEFTNVSVAKEANIYFDGQVISRTVIFTDGTKKTLGVMLPGNYEFATEVQELMEISSGAMEVMLPNAKFSVRVHEVTNYCCSYFS